MNAYNARDLDRFLGYYAPDAVIEDGTGQVLMRVGPYVVDDEAITGFHLAGFPTEVHAAAVYRVEGDHIAHVRLLM